MLSILMNFNRSSLGLLCKVFIDNGETHFSIDESDNWKISDIWKIVATRFNLHKLIAVIQVSFLLYLCCWSGLSMSRFPQNM
jgi:hypothetical protein